MDAAAAQTTAQIVQQLRALADNQAQIGIAMREVVARQGALEAFASELHVASGRVQFWVWLYASIMGVLFAAYLATSARRTFPPLAPALVSVALLTAVYLITEHFLLCLLVYYLIVPPIDRAMNPRRNHK